MASKSSNLRQTRNSLDAETSGRAQIVAAFMGLLVEKSIRTMDGQIAPGVDVSIAQLREEFGLTIDVLTAHVEKMDCKVHAGKDIEMAERAHCLAMLLTSVLRAWLKGEDPNLSGTVSAIERAGAWAAARRPPRPKSRLRPRRQIPNRGQEATSTGATKLATPSGPATAVWVAARSPGRSKASALLEVSMGIGGASRLLPSHTTVRFDG
jgi:hypothetical protein